METRRSLTPEAQALLETVEKLEGRHPGFLALILDHLSNGEAHATIAGLGAWPDEEVAEALAKVRSYMDELREPSQGNA